MGSRGQIVRGEGRLTPGAATYWRGAKALRRLNSLIVSVVAETAFQERMVAMGYDPMTGPPEHFASFLRKDVVDWANAIQASGTKAE